MHWKGSLIGCASISPFEIIAIFLLITGCSSTATNNTIWLDWVPYIGVVVAVILGRFLLKLISQKPLPYPFFNIWEQKEIYEKSPAYKEILAQLEYFRRKDPAFDGAVFLKWVNENFAKAIHDVYEIDPNVHHEILREWTSLPPKKKEELLASGRLPALPLEWLKPFCTDAMILKIEKELGADCGRIAGRVITGATTYDRASEDSKLASSKPAILGKTYLWNRRGERFEITKIWQEGGMDHIFIREHREMDERKFDASVQSVYEMELLRPILEECDYTFSRPSGSKEWRLSAKGEKTVFERRPGMHKEGYTEPKPE